MPTATLSSLATKARARLASFRPTQAPTPIAPYLEAESDLGITIFGPTPEGVDRKFFHSLQKNVWIWHENGTTIRYEVLPQGVFKRINSDPFIKLAGLELQNFCLATKTYLSTLRAHLYTPAQ